MKLTQWPFVSEPGFILYQMTFHILIQQSTKAWTIIYSVTHALNCSLLNLNPRIYAGKDLVLWCQENSR